MSGVLQLDQAAYQRIGDVLKYAHENPYTFKRMQALERNHKLAAGTNPNHVVELYRGFRCVYSVDSDLKNTIMLKHLSVSYITNDGQPAYPSMHAVQIIVEAFGFQGDFDIPMTDQEFVDALKANQILVTPEQDDTIIAMNFYQPVELK